MHRLEWLVQEDFDSRRAFAGLTVATSLRSRLGPENEIVVVDKKDSFFMRLAKRWVLTGERATEEASRARSLLERKDVKFIRAEVNKIDP